MLQDLLLKDINGRYIKIHRDVAGNTEVMLFENTEKLYYGEWVKKIPFSRAMDILFSVENE
jgi:hypothetical protein